MNKILILAFMLLFGLSNIVCAEPSDSEVVASFKQYVSDEVTKAIATYEIDNYRMHKLSSGTWYKTTSNLDPHYIIDVQKNNSLISPYIGSVEIKKAFQFYEECSTKGLAEKSTKVRLLNTAKYRFKMAYQDNNWVVTKVELDNCEQETTGSIYDNLKYK